MFKSDLTRKKSPSTEDDDSFDITNEGAQNNDDLYFNL